MPETSYVRDVSEDTRKRHWHKTERGRVLDFVVQLEVQVAGVWKEVIRYHRAHGYPHRDRYNLQGERRKEKLPLALDRALTLADEDVSDNWEVYRKRFLEGEFP